MNQGVIVLGGHVQGLGIIRVFGRTGLECVLIDKTKKCIARHSKFCNKFFHVQDEHLLNFLTDPYNSEKFKNWTIFPTNDFHVKLLSKNKNILGKHYRIASDNWENVEIFYNKKKAYKLASDLRIPIPETFFPEDISSLSNHEIDFPCIVKPAVMHEFYKKIRKKVFVCHNRKELETNYKRALEIIPASDIIVQSIIKGPSKNQFSACFLFIAGQSYVSLTATRMRQHPLDFGNATTYAETVDIPQLKTMSEKLLRKANYSGICEVEFKLDDVDGQYKFLEVNTRTWKWHSIANKTNTPFLLNYFAYLNNDIIEPITGFSNASFRHVLTDIPMQLKLLIKGFKYWNRILKPIENAVWDKHDIKPWLVEKIYLLSLIQSR